MGNFLDLALEGKNNLWRYLLGISIVFMVFYGYGMVIPEEVNTWGPLVNYIIQDFSYILYFLAIVFIIKVLHRRSLRSLITPKKKMNWKLMGVGFLLYFLLMFWLSLLPQFITDPSSLSLNPNLLEFFMFLPLLIILVPVQTTSEELLFRGYILQGTGFITRNIFILAVLNGIIFMLPHLANPEVAEAPVIAIMDWIIFGSFMAYITLKSGTLELAIAGHAANNLFISVISNYEGSVFTTPSLLITRVNDSASTMEGDILYIILSLVSAILIPLLYYALVFKVPPIQKYMEMDS
ncbi:MAG: CPBP family intramembrane metalloprotease [Methanobacteriaceae archaeon]|nr:CPBP family intramembrane metalloprotease [Methanobacteriaceae archaeon]